MVSVDRKNVKFEVTINYSSYGRVTPPPLSLSSSSDSKMSKILCRIFV